MYEKWLQALNKLEYIQGKNKPNVDCIFCAIRDNNDEVVSLKIYEDDICFVSLNLYPYNPAHLLVITKEHIIKFTELKKNEIIHISRVIQGLQMMLNDLYLPKGYNIGLNQGKSSGGSIEHLHFHVVPRFGSELGFIDIIGDTRIVVEGLDSIKKKLKNSIHNYLNNKFFKDFT
ncbi:MAG: HIT domain-containing protein [Candidatus Lokiarchaeota archaeon]|nr:HIT domain-containing protein [Candidatus Lokiarchaeota archaeon]